MSDKIRNTVLALTSHIVPSEDKPLSSKEFWGLLEKLPINEISRENPDLEKLENSLRIQGLLDRGFALAVAVENLDNQGIWTISAFDENYPQHLLNSLRNQAPPILHGFGSQDILKIVGIGVVGSREASDEVLSVAKSAGRMCASNQIPLVSGAAKGVDQAAMIGCAEYGGMVIGVMADSLTKAAKKSDLRELALDERGVFITPYSPDSPFSVGNAMGRNKLIYGLSKNVLVATAEEGKGGTWAGAVEALKHDYATVLAWENGLSKGYNALIKLGAIATSDLENIVRSDFESKKSIQDLRQPEQLTLNI
jgi:predicted Rossmann fold nucleotide-binding protein DprA/Smf involved in DNA uptake